MADASDKDVITKLFGAKNDLDEIEKENAIALYRKVAPSKGTFTEDDVKYHATNPSGRLHPMPASEPQTDGEPDTRPIDDLMFSPPKKGKTK